MKSFWRCYKCGVESINDKPECLACGAGLPFVLQIVPVHFLVPTPNGPIPQSMSVLTGQHAAAFSGPYRVACKPEYKNLRGLSATGEPNAVTCPECKQKLGDEFDRLLAAWKEESGL